MQVLVAGFVVSVALATSNIYLVNIPISRHLRWVVLAELGVLALLYAWYGDRVRGSVATALAACFVGLAGVSAFWSPDPRLTFSRAFSLAMLFVTAIALAHGTRGRARPIGQILLAVLAAAVAVAVAGLVELAIRPDLARVPATTGTPVRYNGLGGNPNTMAMLLALALPLAVWALFEVRSRRARVLGFAVVLLLYGSIVASGSRGAVLSAVLGSLAAALWFAPKRTRALAVAAAAATLVAGLVVMELPGTASRNPVISVRIVPPPPIVFSAHDAETRLPLADEIGFPRPGERQRHRSLSDSSGRFDAWRGAVDQAWERPVAGYGFGTEERVFVDRYYFHYSRRVENTYIATLLQLGVAGVVLLIALVGAILAHAWGLARRLQPPERRAAGACTGVIVGALVLATTQSFLTSVGSPASAPFWICAFLLTAMGSRSAAANAPRRLAERQRDERELDASQRHRKARLDVMGA